MHWLRLAHSAETEQCEITVLPLYYTPLVTAIAQIPMLTRNAVDQAARLGKSLIYSLSIRSCSTVKAY